MEHMRRFVATPYTGVTLTRAQRSRFRLTGLACVASSSSRSLKNTPLPLATGMPFPAAFHFDPCQRAVLQPSPAPAVGVHRDGVGERIELACFVEPGVFRGEA